MGGGWWLGWVAVIEKHIRSTDEMYARSPVVHVLACSPCSPYEPTSLPPPTCTGIWAPSPRGPQDVDKASKHILAASRSLLYIRRTSISMCSKYPMYKYAPLAINTGHLGCPQMDARDIVSKKKCTVLRRNTRRPRFNTCRDGFGTKCVLICPRPGKRARIASRATRQITSGQRVREDTGKRVRYE